MYLNKVILMGFLGNDADRSHRQERQLHHALDSPPRRPTRTRRSASTSRAPNGTTLIVFGSCGEFAAKLKKGAHIQVEGEIQPHGIQGQEDEHQAASDSIRVTPSSSSTARRRPARTRRSSRRSRWRKRPHRPLPSSTEKPGESRASLALKARSASAVSRGASMSQTADRLSYPLLRSGGDDCSPAAQGERRPSHAADRPVGTGDCARLILRWLAHENHAGANIYVAANPLRSGSRRRTKESIASDSPSIYRHRHRWRGPSRCAPGIRCRAAANCDSLHIARQISGALAGRRLRLCASGTDAQAARHCLRRRSRLYRLQPCPPHPRFPQSEVSSCAPSHGRISRRFRLDSR